MGAGTRAPLALLAAASLIGFGAVAGCSAGDDAGSPTSTAATPPLASAASTVVPGTGSIAPVGPSAPRDAGVTAEPLPGRPATSSAARPGTTAGGSEAPTADAEALTRRLVAAAQGAYARPGWPVAEAWTDAGVPAGAIAGADAVADGSAIVVSGSSPVADLTGGTYVAFAVAGRDGTCWYGLVAASGGPVAGDAKPATAACRGTEAAVAFGYG